MFKIDPGPGFVQLNPEDFVAFEHGDEWLDYRTNTWHPTSFSLADTHQVGLNGIFRRPLELSLWAHIKIIVRKVKNRLKKA